MFVLVPLKFIIMGKNLRNNVHERLQKHESDEIILRTLSERSDGSADENGSEKYVSRCLKSSILPILHVTPGSIQYCPELNLGRMLCDFCACEKHVRVLKASYFAKPD